jgi:hypothetical protein
MWIVVPCMWTLLCPIVLLSYVDYYTLSGIIVFVCGLLYPVGAICGFIGYSPLLVYSLLSFISSFPVEYLLNLSHK